MPGAFYPPIGVPIYASFGVFPAGGNAGDLAVAADTGDLYEWNGSAWQQIGGPGGAFSLGNLDSETASAKGANLVGGVLAMQSASVSNAGLINTTTQSFVGAKTFTGSISTPVLGLLGTTSGTLGMSTAATTTNYNLTWPSTQGGISTFLKNDGSGGLSWAAGSGGGGVDSVGTINSQTKSADGLVIVGTTIYAQTADASFPGLMSTGTQTIAGAKTFSGAISASNLSGTNTGDVTIGAFGSTPNANGLSLSSQVLNLQPADTTHSGGLSSADWNTFNGKQASGNYLTALTGDGTASGPGSAALTLATVNSNVGSFTNAFVTVNAKGLVTAAVSATTTGTGSTVLATAPTMTNPVVGTQSQGDASTKAASTSYVDTAVANAVAGINPAVAVQAATTAAGDTSGFTYNNGVSGVGATFTGTTNTAITIDGFTFTALGQRLLVKNDTQSPSGAFNGVYYVTQVQTGILPPILTRALDYDTPSDINNTGAIPVVNGTVNGTTSWVQTAQIVTVGTTPLVFVQFSKNPAAYLLVANNLSDVANKATSFNNLSPMTTGGDIIYGGASGAGTRLANGSSGQVLTSAGTTLAPTWSAVPSSAFNVTSQTSNYNANTNDYVVCSGSSFTVTLPTVVGNSGKSIVIEHNGTSLTNIYTLNTTSGQTVGGLASGVVILYTQGESFTLIADATNTNWRIQDHKTDTGFISAGAISLSATAAFVFSWTGNQNIVQGSTYTDGSSNVFTVTTSTNTTSGTFSGPTNPATTGTLTLATGTGVSSIVWTSRTVTGQPVIGTNGTNLVEWSRSGKTATVRYILNQSGAGTAGSGDYILYLPSGVTLDTSIVPAYVLGPATTLLNNAPAFPSIVQSSCAASNNTTSILGGVGVAYSATSFRFTGGTSSVTNIGSTNIQLSTATIGYNFTITIPVSGWQP